MSPTMIMITSLAVLLALAPGRALALETVYVLPEGQYYHRAGHLVVPDVRELPLEQAASEGFAPDPECAPPVFEGGKLKPTVKTLYFERYLAERASGNLFSAPVAGRVPTLTEMATQAGVRSALAERGGPGAAAGAAQAGAPGGAPAGAAAAASPQGTAGASVSQGAIQQAAQAAQSAVQAIGGVISQPPGAVPGTGGLIQAPNITSGVVPTSTTFFGTPIEEQKK